MANPEAVVRKGFSPDLIDDILKFANQNSLPPHRSPAVMRHYLTTLNSSPSMVFDLFQGSLRVATGVMLDAVRNQAGTTAFELLGIRRESNEQAEVIYKQLLDHVERFVPNGSQGLTLFYHFMHPFDERLLRDRGYQDHLSLFRLVAVRPELKKAPLPTGLKFEILQVEQFDIYYEILKRAFADNLDFVMPNKERMLRETLNRQIAPFMLFENFKPVGFVSFAVDEAHRVSGEIKSLGVLPTHRKRGYGRLLLENAVQALLVQGVTRVNINVSAMNPEGLKLYTDTGFQVVDRFAGFIKR